MGAPFLDLEAGAFFPTRKDEGLLPKCDKGGGRGFLSGWIVGWGTTYPLRREIEMAVVVGMPWNVNGRMSCDAIYF